MSDYADYIRERLGDHILEEDGCFATYRYLGNGQVYILDIYVNSELRKQGKAAELADRIAATAKQKNCHEMLGSVQPSAKGSTTSMKVLLAYGFEVMSAQQDFIFFKKAI